MPLRDRRIRQLKDHIASGVTATHRHNARMLVHNVGAYIVEASGCITDREFYVATLRLHLAAMEASLEEDHAHGHQEPR